MHFSEKLVVPAQLPDAWAFIWDAPRLASCLPGCVGVEEIAAGKAYKARFEDKVGPYKVKFDLDIQVKEMEPLKLVRILASGRDTHLGVTQRVDLTVTLHESSTAGTELQVEAEIEVLGKVAALGQFVVKRKAQEVVKQFTHNIEAELRPAAAGARRMDRMLNPFRIISPTTVPEAAAELDRLGEAARIYAGGAELLLLMRQGIVEPEVLVNIKTIPSLHGISWDGQALHLGAAVTHREMERSALVHEHAPTLGEAESHVGNVRVRTQGTLGGNLAFADPHADPGTALLVHDATVTLEATQGPRQMPLDDFFVRTYETALDESELLTEVQVPPLPDGWGWSYERIERFYRPTVNAAAAVTADNGHIGDVRLAVGCVGPRALRLRDLEDRLRGLTFADAQREITSYGEPLAEQLEPVSDLLGASDYKIYVTCVLLARAVENALARAGGRT